MFIWRFRSDLETESPELAMRQPGLPPPVCLSRACVGEASLPSFFWHTRKFSSSQNHFARLKPDRTRTRVTETIVGLMHPDPSVLIGAKNEGRSSVHYARIGPVAHGS